MGSNLTDPCRQTNLVLEVFFLDFDFRDAIEDV